MGNTLRQYRNMSFWAAESTFRSLGIRVEEAFRVRVEDSALGFRVQGLGV